MYAEKFELLEAKIRETAMLVSRLREEKWQLEQENVQLRERIAMLEAELQRRHAAPADYAPNIDTLLQQLDNLQHEHDDLPDTLESPETITIQDALDGQDQGVDDDFYLATVHEQKGELEQAAEAYQRVLEVEPNNLEVTQRLAFLLEKLHRDTEAARLWDRIWAMREAQSPTNRRRPR